MALCISRCQREEIYVRPSGFKLSRYMFNTEIQRLDLTFVYIVILN